MATRDDIVVWMKTLLNKPVTTASDDTTGKPNNAEILLFLENARRRLYSALASEFPARFTSTTDLTYTANAENMTLPSAAQTRPLVSIYKWDSNGNNAEPIHIRNVAALPRLGYGNDGTHGLVALVDGTRIRLRPIPGADTTIRIAYVAALTDMATGSAVPSEWPEEFHRTLGTAAVLDILRKNGDPDAGLEQMVKDAVDALHSAMRSQVDDSSYVVRAPPGPFDGGM